MLPIRTFRHTPRKAGFARLFPALGVLLLTALPTRTTSAADGDPLAIRSWPSGVVSIETHWGLRLVVANASRDVPPPQLLADADQVLTSIDNLNHQLDRPANTKAARYAEIDDHRAASPHAMFLTSRPAGLIVDVDGLRILLAPADRLDQLAKLADDRDSPPVDVLIISQPTKALLLDQRIAKSIVGVVSTTLVFTGAPLLSDREWGQLSTALELPAPANVVDHNTTAVAKKHTKTPLNCVVLGDQAWQMPANLTGLFEAMEASCTASQDVFRPLSVAQLNFKPANGTHTPRWNCEHMMGRQLLFFSQIYHALDETIPVLDLNPKQMPPDYEFAHPDWTGEEEALQMDRVSRFTRRFAYLLEDVPLDQAAPGSRWTLRGLLRQMDRHYEEHTANTVKKFELPGWPAE